MSGRIYGGRPCHVRQLSAAETIACIREAGLFRERLTLPDELAELTESLAEYGALCCFCLESEDGRAFPTPEAALAGLTLDELCDVYDEYLALSSGGGRLWEETE